MASILENNRLFFNSFVTFVSTLSVTFHSTRMVNGCVKCLCGVGYGACYIFIGVWGIIMLGIMGILMKKNKEGNIGIEYPKDADIPKLKNQYANTLLWTVLIYFVIVVFCIGNVWYRVGHPWKEEVDPNAAKQFSAIGPKNFEIETQEPAKPKVY